jgi:iodotyrosine deiodinase
MSCHPKHVTVPLEQDQRSEDERRAAQGAFVEAMANRRTVRDFSTRPVPFDLIEQAIQAASSAPSGAHVQPWRFLVVSDPELKRALRAAAEEEERRFYEGRASKEWLEALAPLGTDWRKPFIEDAPYLIVVMEVHQGPSSAKPYYPKESVGIAVGMLLSALHLAGLATLTHTPSPMRFVAEVLGRPREERPFVLIPVGYPAEDAEVPDLQRKPLSEVMVTLDGS